MVTHIFKGANVSTRADVLAAELRVGAPHLEKDGHNLASCVRGLSVRKGRGGRRGMSKQEVRMSGRRGG